MGESGLFLEELDDKYIRDKERYLISMAQHPESPKVRQNRQEKAKQIGLEYLCQDTAKKTNAWYKLPCGHIKMLSNSDYYKKVFHCYGCQVMEWEKEAVNSGMEFLRKIDGESAEYLIESCQHKVILPTYQVRNHKNRKCDECHIEELTQNAKEKDLEFIRKDPDESRKSFYRFLTCGHEQSMYNSHVRRDKILCMECDSVMKKRMKTKEANKQKKPNTEEEFKQSYLEQRGRSASIEKWTAEAEGKGFTFLCRDNRITSHGWYKLPCGHIKRIEIKIVRQIENPENILCSSCIEESRKKTADKKGLEFIEAINGDKGFYRFQTCGHLQEVFISDVERNEHIICKTCIIEKWMREAEAAGLFFVRKIKNKKALYECQTCHETQEIHINAVRSKEFLCHGCQK